VHRGDEVGKLTGPDPMMPYITPDDFRREKWTDTFSSHWDLSLILAARRQSG
jgi:hypothetical protein